MKADKAVIAIPQMGTDLFRKYMKGKYVKSLSRAGLAVRWIELSDLQQAEAEALACDGMLFPGGADLAPGLYGQQPTPECGKPNAVRDAAEPELFRAFLASGKPILCICRGVQLMNVCLGGTLHQDIKAMQKCKHSDFLSRARSCHSVDIAEGTRLHKIYGSAAVRVNSIHHQAVDAVGEGLIASAVSADGFVEGLEMPEHPFCIGVQWHPEHMSAKSREQRLLFEAFAKACNEKKSQKED